MIARLKAHSYSLAILAAILLGAFVRLYAALTADFPLNDGGLFYIMAQDIRDAHYALPHLTSYNAGGIPFAYPPLSFYLAAGLADLTGASLLDVVRILPPVLTALTVPAFYLLSRTLVQSRLQRMIAVFAFAVLPRSFEWLVMGGGLTRSLAFLFTILLLHQIYHLYTSQQPKFIVTSVLLGSVVVLSHPGTSWFACLSVGALFFLVDAAGGDPPHPPRTRRTLSSGVYHAAGSAREFFGRRWRNVGYSLLIALGIIALTAPWWITLIDRHGVEPLIAAFHTRSSGPAWAVLLINLFYLTGEPFIRLLSVTGFLGIVAALVQKKRFLPAWFVVILVLDPRSAPTDAMIPFAMLIALAVDEIVIPTFTRSAERNTLPAKRISAALLSALLIYGAASAITVSIRKYSLLQPLPSEERQAMDWIARSTATEARFLVLSPAELWEADASAEWFPALAQRRSVNTVQGYEWLPGKKFSDQRWNYLSLRKCLDDGLSCLEEDWAYDYVYIANRSMGSDTPEKYYPALIDALKASSGYELVYETEHISLFARLMEE